MEVDTGFALSILVRLRMSVMYLCCERRTPVGVLMTSMPEKKFERAKLLNSKVSLEVR